MRGVRQKGQILHDTDLFIIYFHLSAEEKNNVASVSSFSFVVMKTALQYLVTIKFSVIRLKKSHSVFVCFCNVSRSLATKSKERIFLCVTISATSFHASTAGTFVIYMLLLGPTYDLETNCILATRQTDRQMERKERLLDRQMERELPRRKKRHSPGLKTIDSVSGTHDWPDYGHLIDLGTGIVDRAIKVRATKIKTFSWNSCIENITRSRRGVVKTLIS